MLAAIGSVWQTHLMFSETCTKTRIRDCQYECDRIIDNARKIECYFFFLLEKIHIRSQWNQCFDAFKLRWTCVWDESIYKIFIILINLQKNIKNSTWSSYAIIMKSKTVWWFQ